MNMVAKKGADAPVPAPYSRRLRHVRPSVFRILAVLMVVAVVALAFWSFEASHHHDPIFIGGERC
jgi:hypothetical protein